VARSDPDEVGAKWPEALDTWYRAPHWAAIPGGESLQDVLTRTVAVLREVIGRHPRETVVLVGHDSVNRIILLHACPTIGGSARILARSTRSTSQRASSLFDRLTGHGI
jgi:broad specificity phosphatase PhoE